MSRKEVPRAGLVKAALAGRISNCQVATAVHLSVRQVQRLKRRFRAEGLRGLLHRARGQPSRRRLPAALRRQVAALMRTPYAGFNDCHLTEKLQELHHLPLSRSSVRRLRRTLGLPAKHRRRARLHRSRRIPEAQLGALVQLDGSPFDWLEGRGPEMTLLGAIDDATATVLALHFRPTEDLQGYTTLLNQLGLQYGLPLALYGDRLNILVRNDPHWTLEEELRGAQHPTHFGRMLQELGIGYLPAGSPQAKGLTDPHPTIRSVAARIIAHVDPQEGIPSLIKALADEDQGVCGVVALAIGRVGDRALDPTMEALNDPALENGAIRALEHLPVARVAQAIRSYTADRAERALHYHNLWRQCHSLGGDDERRRLLADALRRKSVGYGIQTLKAMGLLGDRQAIGLAIENLHSRSPGQRANALETLEATGESNLVRPLLCLWDWDDAISGTPDPSSNGWLLKVLRDSDSWIRACAALAVRDSHDTQITAELTHLAQNDSESFVRDSALASMGGTHMDTLSTLSLMERVLFLRRVPLFNELPPNDLKQIAAIAGERFFTDGETIATQGEPGDEMYIIVSGEVLVSARAEDGTEIKIGMRKPGEYVGEMAIISHGERVASLTASGDVRTLSIGHNEFEEMLRMRPEISLAIIHALCGRLKKSISA